MDLYLIAHADSELAQHILAAPVTHPGPVTVVLLPQARVPHVPPAMKTYTLRTADVPADPSGQPSIDYDALVDLIFSAERARVI